eukprot:889578-Pyramimonas_sp.AAC.1
MAAGPGRGGEAAREGPLHQRASALDHGAQLMELDRGARAGVGRRRPSLRVRRVHALPEDDVMGLALALLYHPPDGGDDGGLLVVGVAPAQRRRPRGGIQRLYHLPTAGALMCALPGDGFILAH